MKRLIAHLLAIKDTKMLQLTIERSFVTNRLNHIVEVKYLCWRSLYLPRKINLNWAILERHFRGQKNNLKKQKNVYILSSRIILKITAVKLKLQQSGIS